MFWTHEIPDRKTLGPTRRIMNCTKYPREKFLDPRDTNEKKFQTHEILMRKYFRPMRKHFGPMKLKEFSTLFIYTLKVLTSL